MRRNLFPNPRAHVNASDGWDTSALGDATWERVTSAPAAFPDGADAAFHLAVSAVGYHYVKSEAMAVPAGATSLWALSETLVPAANATAGWNCELWFLDSGGTKVGSSSWDTIYPWFTEEDIWVAGVSETIAVPAGAVTFVIRIGVSSTGFDLYLTNLMFDFTDPHGIGNGTAFDMDAWEVVNVLGYRDGDSAGWEWDAAAHDSASREAAEPYGANVLINGGACMVFDRDVTLTLNPGTVAATEMAVRNDGDAYGAWETFAASKAWTLSAACKVWAKFRDSA